MDIKEIDLKKEDTSVKNIPDAILGELKKYYHEMPNDVKFGIASDFRKFYPEVDPRAYLHMGAKDIEGILRNNSELAKTFDREIKSIRFSVPSSWVEKLRPTAFAGAWDKDSLRNGLQFVISIYDHPDLDTVKRSAPVLQFFINYLIAWLRQKELGMKFYIKNFCSKDYQKLYESPVMLYEIIEEYLKNPTSTDPEEAVKRAALEKLFWAGLNCEPARFDGGKDVLFSLLDLMRAYKVNPTIPSMEVRLPQYEGVSVLTESEVADNIGQVSLFGRHNFGTMKLAAIKEDLIRLNRNTISEYLGGKLDTTGISFNISEQVKMMLSEELNPSLCAVTIRRGNELDMVTLLTYENKTYLLFRKIGKDDITFGISVGVEENGTRELIGISNESDFTYRLVGDEELLDPEV